MSAEPIESLMSRIMDQYNRKPEGWTVLADHKGNVLVMGPNVGYRLKLTPLNPQEYTGVGIMIDDLKEVRNAVKDVPSYGFRPLSYTETKELLKTIRQGDTLQNKLIKKLLGVKPVPALEIPKNDIGAILSGPIITHPNLSAISKGQKELESRLEMEADKLFRRKYPHRAAIYG